MKSTSHTPDSLADELDRLTPEQAANSDDPVIAAAGRFSTVPPPILSPDASARIHDTVLAHTVQPPRSPRRWFGQRSIPAQIALVAVLLLLIAGTVWAAQQVIPLLRPLPTSEPASIQPIPTLTPLPTSQPTLPATIVIEGPIQSIDGHTVVIFGRKIVLNSADPIVNKLQVGDVLHVEGAVTGGTDVITAVRSTPVSVEIDVNPANNSQTWRDPGNCLQPPPDWAPANGWRRRCQSKGG